MKLIRFGYVSLFAVSLLVSAKREAPKESTYITYDSEWTYEPVNSKNDYNEPVTYSDYKSSKSNYYYSKPTKKPKESTYITYEGSWTSDDEPSSYKSYNYSKRSKSSSGYYNY